MAALFGLALLGQVACAEYITCIAAPQPEVAPVDAPAEDPPAEVIDACGMPLCSALGQRLYCIEGFESGHSATAVNRSSGARGWLQWLPSTARAWGVSVGDRQSEWSVAASMATRGETFFRSQWPITAARC